MALVDIVVVSFNSSEHLRACVEPLAGIPDFNVIVVDNASRDDSLASLAGLPVAAVALPENHGFAYGCNVGWRLGEARYVFFLNPDAQIAATSLDRLARTLENDARLGGVAPKIVAADGSLDYSLRRLPRLRSTYARALFLHRLFPRAGWSDEIVRDDSVYARRAIPEWVSGAALLVRRDAIAAVGGFDERFFHYGEDMDLCRRLRDAGLPLGFEPEAVVVHEGGASAPRSSLLPELLRSRLRYAQKHYGRVAASLERLGLLLEQLVRTVVARGGLRRRADHFRAFRAGLPDFRGRS